MSSEFPMVSMSNVAVETRIILPILLGSIRRLKRFEADETGCRSAYSAQFPYLLCYAGFFGPDIAAVMVRVKWARAAGD